MIEGQTVDFQCEAKGYPQPVIAWTKGGRARAWFPPATRPRNTRSEAKDDVVLWPPRPRALLLPRPCGMLAGRVLWGAQPSVSGWPRAVSS